MKKFINLSKTMQKIVIVSLLLILASFSSILLQYKTTGVISILNKKLPIYCVDTQEKKIALTFDNSIGIERDNTKEILQILDKHNVKATFFLVGAWIDKYPELVKEIQSKGHEIGNHSNKHPDMNKMSANGIIQDIAACDAKIMSLTGDSTKLFRFPSGSYNDLAVETVENTNHFCIQWDVDSIDWKEQGKNIEYNRVINKVKSGSIILFHNNAKYTPENLERIIEKLYHENYTFVKVSDLIYKKNFKIDTSGKQISND